MPRKAASFPHPVIGHGDDVQGGVPQVELVRHIDEAVITLAFSGLKTSNATVARLIADGAAVFAIRVICAATYFRRVWTTVSEQINCAIASTEVANELKVEVRICATRPISGYRPDGLHPDYGSASFTLEVGDMLAICDEFSVTVLHDWDPLTGPIDSIIRICEGNNEVGPFSVDLDTDYIEIWISKRDWKLYNQIKQRYAPALHAALILPALVEAVSGLTRDEDVEAETLRWRLVVRKRLEQKGLLNADPLLAAQALLDEPLFRGVKNIVNRLEEFSS